MIYLPVPALVEPDVIAEFHVVIRREGRATRATIVDLKLDPDPEATQAMLIFSATMQVLLEWAHGCGVAPAAIIGDGGPEVLALKQRIYALQEELAKR